MPNLILCRHAIAADDSPTGHDADRPLTQEGIKKFRKSARGLVELFGDHAISHILTSPYLRARQTAEILSDALARHKRDIPPKISDALAPPADLKALLKQIRALKSATAIVAVGHEPTMSHWIGELCFGRAGHVQVKKGAIAVIELADTSSTGELIALLQPGMLRDI